MTIKFLYKYLGTLPGFFWAFSVLGNPSTLPTFRLSPLTVTSKKPLDRVIHPERRFLKGPEWRALQSDTLSESLEDISNLTVLPSGGTESMTKISLSGAPSSGTLVMWEDLILNDPGSPDGGFDFSTLGAETFDCVEIFEGNDPRFGTSGTGGTIRLHTMLDDKAADASKIRVEGGSFGEGLLKASHTVSFKAGKLKIGASGLRGDGAPISRNPSYRKRQGFQSGIINLSGRFDLKKSRYLSFIIKEGENRLEDLYSTTGHFQSNSHMAGINFLKKSEDGKTEEKFSMLKNLLVRQSFLSSDKTDTYKGDRIEGKYNVKHAIGSRVTIEAGGGVVQESLYQFAFSKERSFGYVFVSPTWKITPLISWNVGGRSEGEKEGKPLYAAKSSLNYQKEGRVLSFSLDSAQKRPTLFELYASGPYVTGNQSLKPEKSEGIQVMLLQKNILKKADLGMRLFGRRFQDAIVGAIQNGQWTYEQASPFWSKGVEPFMDIKFSEKWKLHGELTYTNIRTKNPLPRILTPSFKTSGTLFYMIEEGQVQDQDMSALYLKTRYINNSISASGQKLVPYSVFDMGGQYKINQNLKCYVRLNNIFNKSYPLQSDTSLKGEPFTFHVGIGVQF